jgi:glycosyltransferase involved in cell wall biosynthesis
MKIVHISPGAGGMICGACLHDNTLAGALIRQGHDVTLIPIYTPMRTDEEDFSDHEVFFGAINVFLNQRSRLFRTVPTALTHFLDSPGLLRRVARADASIDASQLGALTVSMLEGEDGAQSGPLEELVASLRDHHQPDIVHLSNSLLLGMAHRLREELKVPVVCSLQGEEIFIHDLIEPYKAQVTDLVRRQAAHADAFIAPSSVYAGSMAELLGVDKERIHHVPLGLHLEGHGGRRPTRPAKPFVIGYLARICPEKGLHLLVDAVTHLVEKWGPEAVRLRVAGYLGGRDRAYFESVQEQVKQAGLEDVFDHVGEVDRDEKITFLKSVDVLSVPTPYHEPKGLFVLEALANGTPVVQPDHGAFPELIRETGGGVLCAPDDSRDLARALAELADDPVRRQELGRRGALAVAERYHETLMADRTLAVYHALLDASPAGA